MDTEQRIQDAVAAGERNKMVMELVHNWCRHARVRKLGGTGMVEAVTGLPIGHHAMACDYAAAPGMGTWDLAEAALDFHDRNCVGCAHRDPVALPNLSKLVEERDRARAREAAQQDAHAQEVVARREVRSKHRADLRTKLPVLAAAIVDLVGELDDGSSKDAGARLLSSAELASDTFDPLVIDYLFELLERRERWFDEVGLKVLRQLKADPSRLTRCAMMVLADLWAGSTAAEIVESHARLVDESQVAAALPALIERAHPRRYPMQHELVSIPGPLIALHRARPAAVEHALGSLLDRYEPHFVSVGARGIECLSEVSSSLPSRFARSLVAKLVRSKHLMGPEPHSAFHGEGVLNDLQNALALAFQDSPEETDSLAMEFIAGAASEDEVKVFRVYELVLRGRRRQNSAAPPDFSDRIALRRLLKVATQSDSHDVLTEILGTFTYVAGELLPLVREELSSVLGTAIVLSDKLESPVATPILESNPASQWERNNIREQRRSVQHALVDWAAAAAADDPAATAQYLEVVGSIRDEHEGLRAELIERMHRLMESPTGLNAALPVLYGAMFGSAVRVRAAAAAAIGKLDGHCRDDMPVLVHEALIAHLSDSYVAVHRTALDTLERGDLPESLTLEASAAVARLINAYHSARSDDRFLLKCVCLFAARYTTEADRQGRLGDTLLQIVSKISPDVVSGELRWLRRQFAHKALFSDIVMSALEEARAMEYREDDLLRVLNDLPEQELFRHRARLEALGSRANASHNLPRKLAETLTRIGAWPEAARLTEAVYARIPATVEMHVRKLDANLYRIAAQYEAAIASNCLDLLPGLAREWKATEAEIEKDQIAHERHRRIFPNIPSTD
jgi:hypothetical protein